MQEENRLTSRASTLSMAEINQLICSFQTKIFKKNTFSVKFQEQMSNN